MKRVLFSAAMSLDGFIAGPNGEFDWIPMDPAMDWGAFTRRFDTVLMGRKTWEINAGGGGGTTSMTSVVFTRTVKPGAQKNVTFVADQEGLDLVRTMREGTGKDIWLMGGGVLFASLLEAGLVDVVEIGLIPIILGGGIPLLPPPHRMTQLKLTDSKTYAATGTVLLTYDVVREGG